MQSTYLSAAETAKLVRKALKAAFPGVKFSVRSDGNSIDVRWTDGPAVKMVEAVACQYQGGGFDGMIDLAYDHDHWLLPDGSAVIASSPGTEGSRGVVPRIEPVAKPHPDARAVRFGARYVFCNRGLSPAFQRQVFARLARRGIPEAEGIESMDAASSVFVRSHDEWLCTLAHREAVRPVIARAAA